MSERVVIVGAGPAGIRAAEVLTQAGLRPTVVDEGMRCGGQIYRRPPEGFTRTAEKLYGFEAEKAQALHASFGRMLAEERLAYCPQSSVLSVAENGLQVLTAAGLHHLAFDRLIIATGATERVAPVEGWESAGVYGLGAMQIALKSQGVALGRRIVLAGSGPLLTLVAAQLLDAGADVATVLDTSSLATQMRGLPLMLARPGLVARGMAMRARLGRRYLAGVRLDRIETSRDGVEAIAWSHRGTSHRTKCDAVGLGWHLRSETQLAGLAGADFRYDDTFAQWLPQADSMGRAGDRLYLAGDGLRLLGADGAQITGRLAASACLKDMGLPFPDMRADLRRMQRLDRFAAGLSRAFPWPAEAVRRLPDEAVVCRCESVTAGALREAVDAGASEANRAKSLSRVGMGRCQGRYCQLAGAEIVAARAGLAVAAVRRLRDQAPVRPAPIGALSSALDPTPAKSPSDVAS
ncbi:NAD(P)/FAD-dependent oxidoreductase [Jiella mangrovi]|uniref:NAD(P)/FAD-dependent oxidoreductase n=1 Tax=Jiella mangrovi TaxID=2821407 RepID=A0ABS4BKA4_9HYPH|nr:FAD/NAD(P)-binding oxidoreductase [Jiella mangrovi]MBP0616370.1 NAD(P)/FAD-dependent oxidoreductase [Jiella mangrovi]